MINYEEFESDLKEELAHFIVMLGFVFGDDVAARLLSGRKSTVWQVSGDDVPIEQYVFSEHGHMLFEYAVNARLETGWGASNFEEALRALDVVCRHNLEIEGGVLPSVEMVWKKAFARARLDSYRHHAGIDTELSTAIWAEGPITIEDVSYLCDMTPASVRNSTMANAKDPLKVVRRGKRVDVDPESLIDWLSRRKAYKETIVVRVELPENPHFSTVAELGGFLIARIRNQGLSPDRIAEIFGLDPAEATGVLLGKPIDPMGWGIDKMIAISAELDLEGREFVPRAVEVILAAKMKSANLLAADNVVALRQRPSRSKKEN